MIDLATNNNKVVFRLAAGPNPIFVIDHQGRFSF
jgi:hypothetical protein